MFDPFYILKKIAGTYLSAKLLAGALGVGLLLFPGRLSAQTVIGGETADSTALLDLQSTEKGFLLPRLTNAERDAIARPAKGLMIYHTEKKCVQVNIGSAEMPAWRCISLMQLASMPELITFQVNSVTATAALGGGRVTSDGGNPVIARGVVWSEAANPVVALSSKTTDGSGSGNFNSLISGLNPGTTYYLRAYATNSQGTAYGNQIVFSTPGLDSAFALECGAYVASGEWRNFMCFNLGSAYTGDVPNRLLTPSWEINGGYWHWGVQETVAPGPAGSGAEAANAVAIAGWKNGYTEDVVYGWSIEEKRSNDPCPPGFKVPSAREWLEVFTYNTVTPIGTNWIAGATNYGTGIRIGNSLFLPAAGERSVYDGELLGRGAYGAYWTSESEINQNAAFYLYFDQTSVRYEENEAPEFPPNTSPFAGLSVRCIGMGSGFQASPPIVKTNETGPTGTIFGTSALAGGTVESGGGAPVTARGVVWSTSPGPTVSLPTKTMDGSGLGYFESIIDGLMPNTTYYYRAYATNSAGTAYGQEALFSVGEPSPPTVGTSIVSVGNNTATVAGYVDIPYSSVEVIAKGVVWDTFCAPTILLPTRMIVGGEGSFDANISSLKPGKTYYVRTFVLHNSITTYGNEETFTTAPLRPVLTTAAVSNLSSNSASSGGNITDDGGSPVILRGVVWGTTSDPTISLATKTSDASGNGGFSSSISRLKPGTTYYLRAFATNSAGTAYGNQIIFTTNAILPVLSTSPASLVTGTSAVSGGTITSDGGGAITARGVVWSNSPSPSLDFHARTVNGNGSGGFTSNIAGLLPGTTYFLRAYAINSAGIAYGNEITFATPQVLPTVTTTPVSDISDIGAASGGDITNTGGGEILSKGVVWGTGRSPTVGLPTKTNSGPNPGTFISFITGLSPGTTYFIRAYATNNIGTGYGAELSFTTEITIPTVITGQITSLSSSAATGSGNVTANGGSAVTNRGLVWGTASGPTTALSTKTSNGSGTGSFSGNITGLSPGTTYYLRAYATNSAGTAYGTEVAFTALPVLPTVTTAAITELTSNTAIGGGNILSTGGAPITARGVVWSKANTPAINTANRTTDGIGAGSFISNLSGLLPGTTYFVRAYATNSAGTAYGNEIKIIIPIPPGMCGAFLALGDWREFMCYNLGAAYTGTDSLRLFTPSWEINGGYWQWGIKEMAAAGPAGPATEQANSGQVSTWTYPNTAPDNAWSPTTKTIHDPCPAGFRVPSLNEWTGVINNNPRTAVGSSWTASNTNYQSGQRFGTRLFLSSAGSRDWYTGTLRSRGEFGEYWSSSGTSGTSRVLRFNVDNASIAYSFRGFGYSLRCIAE